jgi:predicted PolB exonuclease-like 3'-5' exonuclease
MNIFTFDIETIPDIASGRKLNHLQDLNDQAVADFMINKRREENGSDFLPLYLHQIVAISAVLKTPQTLNVWSIGDETSSEKEIIERFFSGIDKYSPILVSWNGYGFDLPVLHYRTLLHGVPAHRYFETGDEDPNFKWNNYINRYHYRHTDIMDILAGYQAHAKAKLDEIAVMLGLPGKMGMSGSQVWESYLNNDIAGIRNYCETDVLNTYLIYQRFRLIQGKSTPSEYEAICQETKDFLKNSNKVHLLEFLEKWVEATDFSL